MADAEAEDRGQVQVGDVGETERLRHAGLSTFRTAFTILQMQLLLANRLQGIETDAVSYPLSNVCLRTVLDTIRKNRHAGVAALLAVGARDDSRRAGYGYR
jgi:hypothetical protein